MKKFLIPLILMISFSQIAAADNSASSPENPCSSDKNWTGHISKSGGEFEYPGNAILGAPDMEPDYGGHSDGEQAQEEEDEGPTPR
ncbi:MAG: hypothetical protein ABJN40_12110 [Sneathiella sp.]